MVVFGVKGGDGFMYNTSDNSSARICFTNSHALRCDTKDRDRRHEEDEIVELSGYQRSSQE
jgi:hypothetical protein